MPWTCRLTEPDGPHEVGDIWFTNLVDGLSVEFEQTHAGNRMPLMIRLPGPVDICLDGMVDDEGGHGWHVRGEPPFLTVTPSIHIPGFYHGHLREGILTNDYAGRRYLPNGRLQQEGDPPHPR